VGTVYVELMLAALAMPTGRALTAPTEPVHLHGHGSTLHTIMKKHMTTLNAPTEAPVIANLGNANASMVTLAMPAAALFAQMIAVGTVLANSLQSLVQRPKQHHTRAQQMNGTTPRARKLTLELCLALTDTLHGTPRRREPASVMVDGLELHATSECALVVTTR